MRGSRFVSATLFFVLWAWPAAAEEREDTAAVAAAPVEYRLEAGELIVVAGERQQRVALPAAATALLASGGMLYAALGEHGVAVLELSDPASPKLLRQIPVSQGRVVGFFEADGKPWMKIESTTAVPLGGAVSLARAVPTVSAAPSQPAAGAPEADPVRGREAPVLIVEIYLGQVKLNVGSDRGVKVEDRFSVFRMMGVNSEGGEEFEGKELVAVIEVVAVSPTSSLARLWRGDRVRINDEVQPARPDHRPSNVFPRHLADIGELSFVLRPLIKVGKPKGFGALCDLSLAYWGEHYFVDFRMQPLGFGWTEDGSIVSSSFLVEGGYSGRAFGVGLGVGAAVVSGDMSSMLESTAMGRTSDGGFIPESWNARTQGAFALSQVVRMGARDGLNFSVSNILLYHKDSGGSDESGFVYGGTTGKLTIPLVARTDLFFGGGGGRMGYWFGEVGVFAWVTGNGDAGSFGLSASAGAAGLWGDDEDGDSITIIGPMVSIGLTYRFGF